MTVYIDSFFLINFLSDFLVLFLSGRLIGARIYLKRLILSSFTGAIFSCLALFFVFINFIFIKLLVLALMSFLAFGYGSFRSFFRQTAGLCIGFFISGGAAFAFIYISGKGYFVEGIFFFDAPFFLVFLSLGAATITGIIISEKIKAGRVKAFAEIVVYKDERRFYLRALYDSGNICTDFISGLPVIVSENVFAGIQTRKSIFNTASGEGYLEIFIPDYIEVTFKGEAFKGNNAAIGITDKKLSSDGSFNALIGGICFDRLFRENKTSSYLSYKGCRGFLHRGSRTASAAPDGKRGGRASWKIGKGE